MGRIVAPFGIQGWVKVKTFTETADGLEGHPLWWVHKKDGWFGTRLEEFKVRPGTTSAKLEGCDDRSGAELLRGCDVAVPRADFGAEAEGEHYWVDLIGLDVVDLQGKALGKVNGLFESGETDVLVVKGEEGGKEYMIPFIALYVNEVDREAKRITVEWGEDY
jgi:16S rRNA processing protein RimM